MSHGLAICFVIALMFTLIAVGEIPTMPRCVLCGKQREHAKDCPSRDKDDGR